MIITVTPAPSLDRTYTAASLGLGQVNRARTSVVEASGKGVNVSRALAAARRPTMAVLPLGGPEGRQLGQLLDEEAVPFTGVETAAVTRTNTTLAVDGLPTTKMNAPALGQPSEVWEDLLGIVRTLLEAHPGSWLVCSGSVPPGADDLPARLVELARSHGARSVVDGSGSALRASIAARPDLIAPNHLELADLVGAELSELDPDGGRHGVDVDLVALSAAWSAELAAITGGSVLASLGASGALFAGAAGVWHAVGPPIVPVNTVGAGDALLAGFLSVADEPEWTDARAAEPSGALPVGVAWGSAACRMPGTSGDVATLADPSVIVIRPVDPEKRGQQ